MDMGDKDAAIQCTRILQTMWQNWRIMAEYDTRVFSMVLAGASFINLPELWDQLRNVAKRTFVPAKMIQQLLQDAILRSDVGGPIGQRLCQRFSAKFELTKLQQKSAGWETDAAKHMFTINSIVNALSIEDIVREATVPTEFKSQRRNALNIHNTSIYDDSNVPEAVYSTFLMTSTGAPILEECLYAQNQMDLEWNDIDLNNANDYIDHLQQENNILNDQNIMMQAFPMSEGTNNQNDKTPFTQGSMPGSNSRNNEQLG
jgi:hypothetical protein